MTLWIIIGVVVLLALWAVSIYNGLVRLRNNRENAFANIDVQLKQRYDLVPQLVSTVKGYATHEKDLLEKVTWVLVSFILVVSILTTFSLGKNDSATDITDRIENAATEQQLEFPSTPIQSANPSSEAPATEAPSTEAN